MLYTTFQSLDYWVTDNPPMIAAYVVMAPLADSLAGSGSNEVRRSGPIAEHRSPFKSCSDCAHQPRSQCNHSQ